LRGTTLRVFDCFTAEGGEAALEETMHGVKIVDDYRWLEDDISGDAEVGCGGDGVYAGGAGSLPGRDAIHKRLTELLI